MNISKELLNAVLQYLSNQPYAQVAGLINKIHKEITAEQEQKLKSEEN